MISKIIKYQIDNNITQSELCKQIGIGVKTLYNARKGDIAEGTISKIDDFCKKNGL